MPQQAYCLQKESSTALEEVQKSSGQTWDLRTLHPSQTPSLRPAVPEQITPHLHHVPLFCHLQLKHPDKLIPKLQGFHKLTHLVGSIRDLEDPRDWGRSREALDLLSVSQPGSPHSGGSRKGKPWVEPGSWLLRLRTKERQGAQKPQPGLVRAVARNDRATKSRRQARRVPSTFCQSCWCSNCVRACTHMPCRLAPVPAQG